MSRRKATNPDTGKRGLSPAQQRAVDLFASGQSVTQVAATIEMSRQTVSLWANQDPFFKAALNQRRAEIWAAASDQLRNLLAPAIAALSDELQGPNKLRSAQVILRVALGTGGLLPNGATDPASIEADDREQAAVLAQRSIFAGW